jgi:hypothetical protein
MTEEKTEIAQTSAESQVEEKPAEAGADTYHNPNSLFRVAFWAGIVSWIFLVVALANFVLRVYLNIYPMVQNMLQLGQMDYQTLSYYLINELYSLSFMAFVFLLLQGVAQGLYALLDLLEKKQEG